MISKEEWLGKEKKFLNLSRVSALIQPAYNGKTFFDVLLLTSLLEGDLIRIYAQILDRIGQVKKAAVKSETITKLENCQGIIEKILEGIWLIYS